MFSAGVDQRGLAGQDVWESTVGVDRYGRVRDHVSRAGRRRPAGPRQAARRLPDDEVERTPAGDRQSQQQGRAESLTFDPQGQRPPLSPRWRAGSFRGRQRIAMIRFLSLREEFIITCALGLQ